MKLFLRIKTPEFSGIKGSQPTYVVHHVVEPTKHLCFFNVKAFYAKMKYDVHVNMCNFIVLNEEKCVDNT